MQISKQLSRITSLKHEDSKVELESEEEEKNSPVQPLRFESDRTDEFIEMSSSNSDAIKEEDGESDDNDFFYDAQDNAFACTIIAKEENKLDTLKEEPSGDE